MTYPNRNPGEFAEARDRVKVGAVGCMPFAVVVKSTRFDVRLGNAADGLAQVACQGNVHVPFCTVGTYPSVSDHD